MADVNQNRKEIYKKAIDKCNDLQEEIRKNIENNNFIKLKKDSILRIGIKDANGVDTGEHFEFDLEDIEFPLR